MPLIRRKKVWASSFRRIPGHEAGVDKTRRALLFLRGKFTEETRKQRKSPVKGSIQSFFGKAAAAAKQPPTKAASEDPKPRSVSLEQAPLVT
jgi:hypothetical protein